jgi:sulfate permease
MLLYFGLIITSLLFALNMGASGLAPAFAAVYSAKVISFKKSILLFSVFVILGAILLGGGVARTLSGGIISVDIFSMELALIIMFSATFSLFLANLLKVPQSTSWLTVFALIGAAFSLKCFDSGKVLSIMSLWLILPISSFIITFLLFKQIYPPRQSNFWFYEKTQVWSKPIEKLSLLASCYVAFAIGSNNVANAVGPLAGSGIISSEAALLLLAPLFGLGGLSFGKGTLETIGRDIIPLGTVTATLVAIVTASLLMLGSLLGIPQSLVQLNTFAILAIWLIKHEQEFSLKQSGLKKILLVWLIAPVIACALAFFLTRIFINNLE